MHDLLIVGAGPAGLYAWKFASENKISTMIIESGKNYGGQVYEFYPQKNIYNLPFINNIDGSSLIKKMYDCAKSHNLYNDIIYNIFIKKINQIEGNIFNVLFSNNKTYKFKKILFCSGNGKFEPIKLIEKNISNILYSIKDYKIFDNKKVIVFGGGNSALDFANEISKNAGSVNLIHRRNEFRCSNSSLDLARKNKINIYKNYLCETTIGTDQINKIKIKNIENNKEIILDCDYIVVAFGVKIQKNDILGINLKTNDFNNFFVDENQMTNIHGIFSAGDSCTYNGKIKNLISAMSEVNKAILNIEKQINNKTSTITPW